MWYNTLISAAFISEVYNEAEAVARCVYDRSHETLRFCATLLWAHCFTLNIPNLKLSSSFPRLRLKLTTMSCNTRERIFCFRARCNETSHQDVLFCLPLLLRMKQSMCIPSIFAFIIKYYEGFMWDRPEQAYGFAGRNNGLLISVRLTSKCNYKIMSICISAC